MAEDKLNQLKKMLSQKESDKRIAELLTAVLDRVVQKDGYTPQKGIDYFDGEKGEPFRYIDFTPQQLAALKGKDGYTPVKGKDYFDGYPGKDGYTPEKGVDYFDGKPGKAGEPGINGITPRKGIDYQDGVDGVGIKTAELENDDLVITLTNGKIINVGRIRYIQRSNGGGGGARNIPFGGTTGQSLKKKSNTDYDVEWSDSGGGAVESVNGKTGEVELTLSDVGITKGTSTVDFGEAPGTNLVSITILTANVKTDSFISIILNGSTADHNAIEHTIAPIRLNYTNIVDGVSFDIVAYSEIRMTKTYSVKYVIS